eukprot:jgi/Bigna1/87358/estExt_fgenesh1_pg.C_190151
MQKLIVEMLKYNDFTLLAKQEMKIGEKEEKTLGLNNGTISNAPSLVFVVERIDAIDTAKVDFSQDGVYVCPSEAAAKSLISALFPEPFPVERTLALIKPNAFAEANHILPIIEANGFKVITKEAMSLSKARVSEFYAEHKGKSFFDNLTAFMSSGPVMALVLQKPSAIQSWRMLIGPTNSLKARELKPASLRARWGIDGTKNGFHGSDSTESAKREIDFFFPSLFAADVMDPEEYSKSALPGAKEVTSLHDVLSKALTKLCRVKPVGLDAIEWLGNWLLQNNPACPAVEIPEQETMLYACVFAYIAIGVSEVDVVGVEEGTKVMTLPARIKRSKIRVVCAVGPEGSRTEQCARSLSEERDYEHISFPRMMKALSVNSTADVTRTIKDCVNAGRACPTDVSQYHLNKAITAYLDTQPATGSTILISGFPENLDQALSFASNAGEPSVFLSFEGDEEGFLAAANAEAKEANVSEAIVTRRVQRFKDETKPVETIPIWTNGCLNDAFNVMFWFRAIILISDSTMDHHDVVEHYKKFSKVKSIKDRGDVAGVLDMLKAML